MLYRKIKGYEGYQGLREDFSKFILAAVTFVLKQSRVFEGYLGVSKTVLH